MSVKVCSACIAGSHVYLRVAEGVLYSASVMCFSSASFLFDRAREGSIPICFSGAHRTPLFTRAHCCIVHFHPSFSAQCSEVDASFPSLFGSTFATRCCETRVLKTSLSLVPISLRTKVSQRVGFIYQDKNQRPTRPSRFPSVAWSGAQSKRVRARTAIDDRVARFPTQPTFRHDKRNMRRLLGVDEQR